MKINWGKAIFLAMTAFVLLMASFMYRAASNQEELVAEDYYAREIRFQEELDKLNRAEALPGSVEMVLNGSELRLEWPEATHGMEVSSELFLQRPSDGRADARFPLVPDTNGVAIVDLGGRMKGAYIVNLEWSADGVTYLTRDRIHLQ